uniref:Uncharacterized protein n=1 Tax=Arundo donax TaxID=35708 RepID=A0A0A9E8Y1_ARUDO
MTGRSRDGPDGS